MKKSTKLPKHRVLMVTALTHLMAGNKNSAIKALKKAKLETNKFYESEK